MTTNGGGMTGETTNVLATQLQGDSLAGVNHRVVETNGIQMHIAEMGEGPLVVLLHGFPESWYSWRHQLPALAAAGYHAVAPDQRGYGQTDRPAEPEKYTQLHLVGDVIGLLDALGEERAVVVGHDWGAPVAWNTALLRPDRTRGVVGLSVPYAPRGPISMLPAMRAALGDGFYMQYFQAPGVADTELARDVRTTLRRILYGGSGDAPHGSGTAQPVVPPGKGFLDLMPDPETLPDWLTEADIDVFVSEFERAGFTGGLNWYRAIDLTWELMAAWQGAVVTPPALYVAGDRDLVVNFPGMAQFIPHLQTVVPNLTRTIILPGVGHWTQQERPAEVNAALLEFLAGL
jgi:pimeloyl-ACP methyl ester carboxylesterase